MKPWIMTERVSALLVLVGFLLTFMVVYPRIKRWKPHWEGRAELASMVPGLLMLLLLVLLVMIGER